MKLKAKTDKSPMKKNDTRWGSVFAMLKRYLDRPSCSFPRSTRSMFLGVEDHYVIEELVGVLYECEKKNSYFLQNEDSFKVSLLSARLAFDKIVPALSSYLAPDASLVHCPAFESSVDKHIAIYVFLHTTG